MFRKLTSNRKKNTMHPSSTQRTVLRWILSFAGFPIGGLLSEVVVGPVNSGGAAFVGGALTGLVVGSAQWLALGPKPTRPSAKPWIAASGVGLAAGLGIGSSLVDFKTDLSALALQGLISGLGIGIGQSAVLRKLAPKLAPVWPALAALTWAMGWTITTSVGVDVERQYTVFGSTGALGVALVSSVLPLVLNRKRVGQ